MQILKTIGVGILGVVVGLLLAGAFQNENVGGVYSNVTKNFTDGVFTGGITVDTSTLLVDATNNRVGIGTTSPAVLLAVGTAGATSSVNLGKVCYTVTTSNGGTVYYWYGASGNVASSTTSCN